MPERGEKADDDSVLWHRRGIVALYGMLQSNCIYSYSWHPLALSSGGYKEQQCWLLFMRANVSGLQYLDIELILHRRDDITKEKKSEKTC